MDSKELLAEISRSFFNEKKVYKYRMKKVSEMTNDEVIQFCHWYCEANDFTKEFNCKRNEVESGYHYCDYLKEYIEIGQCYDMQMVKVGLIKSNVVNVNNIDKESLNLYCSNCEYTLM